MRKDLKHLVMDVSQSKFIEPILERNAAYVAAILLDQLLVKLNDFN